MNTTRTLYRPVGEKEMILIIENNFESFPPRLEWQPIFYPVLNKEYASQIAEKWNTKDPEGNYLGFVTEFDIDIEVFSKYKIENVGSSICNELWVPSEELEDFNKAIYGKIEVIKLFKGKDYKLSTHHTIQNLVQIFSKHKK